MATGDYAWPWIAACAAMTGRRSKAPTRDGSTGVVPAPLWLTGVGPTLHTESFPPPEQAPGEGRDRPPLRQGDGDCGFRHSDGAAIQGTHKGCPYRGGGRTLGFPLSRE